MGICLSSKEDSPVKSITRSNKVKDCSSFATKDNQSGSTERKPTFQVSRDEAESLLVNAKEGEFLLSEDITAERFISVCSGQFVSHHAIFSLSNGISVGGEYFESISEMLDYYKDHPLGKIKLDSEYSTAQNPTKKTSTHSKALQSRSSNSFHVSSVSSPDHCSESSDHRSLKRLESRKSEIQPLPEENVITVQEVNEKDATRESPNSKRRVSNLMGETTSVSSAGYQDLPLDEPVPVLPEQSYGMPPPPLFNRLSSKSLSNLGVQSFGHNMRLASMRFPSLDPRDDEVSCTSTKMIKIFVSGKTDTFIEQEYLVKDCLPCLSDFCCRCGFICDVIHFTSKQPKLPNKSWALEDTRIGPSVEEIDEINRFGMPVVLLCCFGEKMGPLVIPRKISTDDFERISQNLLDQSKAARLEDIYERDYNDNTNCFVLKRSAEENIETLEELASICDNLLLKCFEGEKYLWKYFQPDLERLMKSLLANLKNLTVIPIERKITDLRKCVRSISSVEAYEDVQDANSYYHLESMRNEWRAGMIESANLRQDDVLTLVTNFAAVRHDTEQRQLYTNMLKEIVMPHFRSKLQTIMGNAPSVENDYCYLKNEIYTHLFECQRKCREFVGDADVLQTVKAYLQGPFQKPLILYGDSGCGRSSIIAKSSSLAKEWLGTRGTIITRLIGSTRDSISLHLLLQSICLQLSFAYKTDPGAVPKSLPDLVRFLPNLFQFATDSQPMIIFIAGIDDLEVSDKQFGFFSFIPPILMSNVKIVVSMHKETVKIAKGIYTDTSSYREIRAKMVQDGIEMLDSMLVAANRTLSESQKLAISNSMISCWSPVYVNILFHKSKTWRGNEDISLPSKVVLQQYIGDIFTDVEKAHGYKNVALISSLVCVSRFGILKKCLCHVLLHASVSKMTSQEAAETVSRILCSLSTLLSSRWLNGHVVCSWFHKSIERVARDRYLQAKERSEQSATELIANYLKHQSNSFHPIAQVETRKSVSAESPGPVQMSNVSLDGLRKRYSESGIRKAQYNVYKLEFFPFYLLQCRNLTELKILALCNFEFLYDKLRASSVGHIINDFYHALTIYPDDRDLIVMKEFFELATDALTLDPEQFPAQVYSRLHPFRQEQQMIQQGYTSTMEKSSMPPPDGKESSSPDNSVEHQPEVVMSNADEEEAGQDGQQEVSTNNKNEATCIDNSYAIDCDHAKNNSPGNNSARTHVSSTVCDSHALATLINSAIQMGHMLMPSRPCLLRPPSECDESMETQVAGFSNQTMDTKILFVGKSMDTLIAWSRSKESIGLYDLKCTCLELYKCPELKRVLLALNDCAVVEKQDGKVWLFDLTNGTYTYELDSNLRYFAVCDNTHVAALSDNLSCASVCNIRSREVVWDFHAPEGRCFHNVLVSKNGAIGVCILEANPISGNGEEVNFVNTDTVNSPQDEIIVINLKSRQQLHSISLRNGQYLHKICSISEDGHYLVHLTEPDHQILVLDLIKGTILREMEARFHRILKIMVSTQGNCILSASADSVLRVWNLSDGELRYSLSEPIRSIRGGYMDDKHCLSMSVDGSRAVHSVRSQFHYSYVVLWDLVQGEQLATFTTDFYGLSYEISPCGDYIMTSMPSGLVSMGANKAMSFQTQELKK